MRSKHPVERLQRIRRDMPGDGFLLLQGIGPRTPECHGLWLPERTRASASAVSLLPAAEGTSYNSDGSVSHEPRRMRDVPDGEFGQRCFAGGLAACGAWVAGPVAAATTCTRGL